MPTTPTRLAASQRNSTFARDAVHLEFRGRDAKAIDQSTFVDRLPNNQVPRLHAEADGGARVIDQFSVVLRQVDADDGLQP